jgi:hypothetical protein
MQWILAIVTIGMLGILPCRASDPLTPGKLPSTFYLRSVGVSFSGRSPGGIAATANIQIMRGLSLDLGPAISRVPTGVNLSTLGIPVVCWGELGTTDIVRFGIGYHWLPLENDGQALVGIGYQLNDPKYDLNFAIDLMYSLDERSRTRFASWLYMFGLTITVPLHR